MSDNTDLMMSGEALREDYKRRLVDALMRLAEAEAARLITRATLTDARRFIVMACGDTAPYAKVMLERIDKALADSAASSASLTQEPKA